MGTSLTVSTEAQNFECGQRAMSTNMVEDEPQNWLSYLTQIYNLITITIINSTKIVLIKANILWCLTICAAISLKIGQDVFDIDTHVCGTSSRQRKRQRSVTKPVLKPTLHLKKTYKTSFT